MSSTSVFLVFASILVLASSLCGAIRRSPTEHDSDFDDPPPTYTPTSDPNLKVATVADLKAHTDEQTEKLSALFKAAFGEIYERLDSAMEDVQAKLAAIGGGGGAGVTPSQGAPFSSSLPVRANFERGQRVNASNIRYPPDADFYAHPAAGDTATTCLNRLSWCTSEDATLKTQMHAECPGTCEREEHAKDHGANCGTLAGWCKKNAVYENLLLVYCQETCKDQHSH